MQEFEKILTKEYLSNKRFNEQKTLTQIAKEVGCNRQTVYKAFQKYHIPSLQKTNAKYLNKKLGLLTVIEHVETKDSRKYFKCLCDCGNYCIVEGGNLLHKRNIETKSCGCSKKKRGKKHKNWDGYKDISGQYLANIKKSAKERRLEHNITPEYIWDLFIKQERRCALSDMEIILCDSAIKQGEQTASLDRIDNSKGYIEGNVQWLHKDINRLKNNYSEATLILFCTKIVDTHRKKINEL